MKIYYKDNKFYIKQGNAYYLLDIIIKNHTVVLMPTNEYLLELDNAVETTYQEIKNRYTRKEESTEEVGSLNSKEV